MIALLLFGEVALLAGSEPHAAWQVFALGVAAVAGALGLLAYCLRRHPWSATIVALVLSLFFSLCSWLFVAFMPSTRATVSLVVGVTLSVACVSYLIWRKVGPEQAPDFLAGERTRELDGISIRVPHAIIARPGRVAWVRFELQNAWTVPIEFRATLRPRGCGVSREPRRIQQHLAPLESGVLWIPIDIPDRGNGLIRVGFSFGGHGRGLLVRRGRLRPKAPPFVGPSWLLSAMAIPLGLLVLAPSQSFEVIVRADAPVGEGEHPAHPEPEWVPTSLEVSPAEDGAPAPTAE